MRVYILFGFIFICSCSFENNKKVESKPLIVELSELVTNDPLNTDVLLQRINYNFDKKNYESALFDLKQCISIDSLNSNFHFLSAKSYFEISKVDNSKSSYPQYAIVSVQKCLEIEPNNSDFLLLYGELQLAFSRYQEAIDLFNKCLTINYNIYKAHHLMGYSFKKLDKIENAINCFQNAININPDNTNSYLELALIFHSQNDSIAIEYYNNILTLDSNDVVVLYNLALFYQENNDYNNSLETYSKLLKIDNFNANVHYNIGFIHMELKLYDIAVNNFADAIYSESSFYQAYYARGICFETLGNIAQAEVDYKRAIEINASYVFAKEALDNLLKNNLKYK